MTGITLALGFAALAVAAGGQSPGKPVPISRAETEALVKQDLARRLKVPAEELTVVSASDRTWPDATLGCGARKGVVEPGPVPGFAVTLAHGGKTYVYHADRRGTIRRCGAVKPRAPIGR